jgi:hypothetical protein
VFLLFFLNENDSNQKIEVHHKSEMAAMEDQQNYGDRNDGKIEERSSEP